MTQFACIVFSMRWFCTKVLWCHSYLVCYLFWGSIRSFHFHTVLHCHLDMQDWARRAWASLSMVIVLIPKSTFWRPSHSWGVLAAIWTFESVRPWEGLEVIPDRPDGYTAIYLKDIQQAKVYICPIQKNLSMDLISSNMIIVCCLQVVWGDYRANRFRGWNGEA